MYEVTIEWPESGCVADSFNTQQEALAWILEVTANKPPWESVVVQVIA